MSDPNDNARDEALGQALGKTPSGLFVCACGSGQAAVPFVASWVQQAGMDPPMISVAIQKGRPALEALDAGGGILALSNLPEGGDALMKPFFGPPGEDPFGGLATARGPNGGVYLQDGLAWLEARAASRCESADHVIVVAEVVAGAVLRSGEPRVHIRKTGFSY